MAVEEEASYGILHAGSGLAPASSRIQGWSTGYRVGWAVEPHKVRTLPRSTVVVCLASRSPRARCDLDLEVAPSALAADRRRRRRVAVAFRTADLSRWEMVCPMAVVRDVYETSTVGTVPRGLGGGVYDAVAFEAPGSTSPGPGVAAQIVNQCPARSRTLVNFRKI